MSVLPFSANFQVLAMGGLLRDQPILLISSIRLRPLRKATRPTFTLLRSSAGQSPVTVAEFQGSSEEGRRAPRMRIRFFNGSPIRQKKRAAIQQAMIEHEEKGYIVARRPAPA
jgi:hypothetical protein